MSLCVMCAAGQTELKTNIATDVKTDFLFRFLFNFLWLTFENVNYKR